MKGPIEGAIRFATTPPSEPRRGRVRCSISRKTVSMHFRNSRTIAAILVVMFIGSTVTHSAIAQTNQGRDGQDARMTPLVKAVKQCRLSVVNLRGKKTVPDGESTTKTKQVNGMGTGVVIDSRGYVLTNYHVVQGVENIEVATGDREQTTARLLAHDPETDLAILKIETAQPLPTIRLGTSSDLMLAETVSAVGNAYGYEHTVTVGIISQLGRTVQVNDEQIYRNLIQTDAAINPGNSGGPLLNAYGEMIGINVAVRIGAQGIAFAIPVNDAMEVAARLMAKLTKGDVLHGLVAETKFVNDLPELKVKEVAPSSPAEKAGLKRGDQIIAINNRPSTHAVHFQSALVGKSTREPIKLSIRRGERTIDLAMKLKPSNSKVSTVGWSELGFKVANVPASEMAGMHENYVRGLRVTEVRRSSPAEEEGILEGDIIVAMHGWKTETIENLAFVLGEDVVRNEKEFMFYILRDREPFWGQMRVASRDVARH